MQMMHVLVVPGTDQGHVGDIFYPEQVFIETQLIHLDKVLVAMLEQSGQVTDIMITPMKYPRFRLYIQDVSGMCLGQCGTCLGRLLYLQTQTFCKNV